MHRVGIFLTILMITCAAVWAEPGANFSQLPADQQEKLREMTAPPPAPQRYGCYSIPMYFLMYNGFGYSGNADRGPDGRTYVKGEPGPDYGHWKLDRNRPEWQEAMLKNWAELGLNSTHLYLFPNASLTISPDYIQALKDFVRLSRQYRLKISVRIDPLGKGAWDVNPDNPQNKIDAYIDWVQRITAPLKGEVTYYILGDELHLYDPAKGEAPPQSWTTEGYLDYFKRISSAIKKGDPHAKVSMFSARNTGWSNVKQMLEHGYARYGDAVAMNYSDIPGLATFFDDARKSAPDLAFISNGVGYRSYHEDEPCYPAGAPSEYPSQRAHGQAIAKNMFTWWDLGAASAPYYINLRNWVMDGKVYPCWFGFMGFEDYVINQDKLTVKRYPGWYAYQTITHTFYNRDRFTKPSFDVSSSARLSMLRAYEHQLPEGNELLLMLWNDGGSQKTTIDLGSEAYRFAVRVDNFNYEKWSDVPYRMENHRVQIDLEVGAEPVILRLMKP